MKLFKLGIIIFAFFANIAAAEAPSKPYQVTVWAEVIYDTTGSPTQVNFPDKKYYPAKFIQNLQIKLATRNIKPRMENDLPATFETDVLINLTVIPSGSGAEVIFDDISEQPRPIKRAMDKYPGDLASGGWSGDAKIKCTISPQGKCTKPEIIDSPSLPESARKFALGSIKAWRFRPQKINSKPISSTVTIPISFQFEDPYPPEYFGKYVL
jgi:TonB family protein